MSQSHKPHGRPGLEPSAVLRWPCVLHVPPCHRVGCALTATCQSSSGLWGRTLRVYTVRLGAAGNHEHPHSSCASLCIFCRVLNTAPHKHRKETCMKQQSVTNKWCAALSIQGFLSNASIQLHFPGYRNQKKQKQNFNFVVHQVVATIFVMPLLLHLAQITCV